MEISQIIENLSKPKDEKLPRESLLEAIKQKDLIEQFLILSLNDVVNQNSDPEDMLPMYSLFLLAQFKCKTVYKTIINILNLPYEQIEEIFGYEILFDNIPDIIISVYDGDYIDLMDIIENTALHYNNRMIALSCVCYLTKNNLIDLDETIALIKKLALEIINGKDIDDSLITDTMFDAYFYLNINDNEYLKLIKQLYELDMIDPWWSGDFDQRIKTGYNKLNHGDLNRIHVIEDTIKEMGWWACFAIPEKEKPIVKKYCEPKKNINKKKIKRLKIKRR